MSSIDYRSDIDGLRAVAVIAVIIFHLVPEWLPGGFVGVDVFFVISGYLITAILVRQISNGKLSFTNFWLRRARRLFPAVAVVLFATLLAGYRFLEPASLRLLGEQTVWTLSFAANFFFWNQSHNYWAPASESMPLLHMWSLAVEEQFYFIFPFALAACKSPRKIKAFLIAAVLLGFVGSWYVTKHYGAAAFFLMPARIWELAAGGAAAVFAVQLRSSFLKRFDSRIVSWAGLVIITAGFYIIDSTSRFPTPAAIIPVVGTLAVIASGFCGHRRPHVLLSNPAVVYVGKLSYSLYLWHWPVIVFSRTLGLHWLLYLCFIPLAILSYHGIENRTRESVPLGRLVAAFAILFLISIPIGKGKLGGYITFRYPEPRVSTDFDCQKLLDKGGLHFGEENNRRVLVFGSSMAYQHGNLLNSVFSDYWVTYLTVGGTPSRFLSPGEDGTDSKPPVVWSHEERVEFDRIRLNALKQKPEYVVISERWDLSNDDEFEKTRQFFEVVCRHANHVIVLMECPILDVQEEIGMQRLAFNYEESQLSIFEREDSKKRRATSIDFFESVGSDFDNLTVIDPADFVFMDDNSIKLTKDGYIIYGNHSHFSVAGSTLLRPAIEKILAVTSGRLTAELTSPESNNAPQVQ